MSRVARTLDELVESWTLSGFKPFGTANNASVLTTSTVLEVANDQSFKDILKQFEYYAERFYSRFVPALFPPHTPVFEDRLLHWLTNEGIDEDQQRVLFEFALRIAYFSFEDFLQLYRSAFVGPVARWIIDEMHLGLAQPDFFNRLEEERTSRTWYCPVTDSMVISEFYHANGITGIDHRPPFRSLTSFAEPQRIVDYMAQKGLKRLVLIEDFVGSGVQSREVVRWAAENLSCPILFVPLVICPAGIEVLRSMAAAYVGRLQIEPVLPLDDSLFLADPSVPRDRLFTEVAKLAQVIHGKVRGIPDKTSGPFGFASTGAMIVLFSNTPDNTLPFIHHHARQPSKWKALFPRVSREIT